MKLFSLLPFFSPLGNIKFGRMFSGHRGLPAAGTQRTAEEVQIPQGSLNLSENLQASRRPEAGRGRYQAPVPSGRVPPLDGPV